MSTELAQFNFGGSERTIVAGRDERAQIQVARLTIYQGTTEEVEQYGEGTFKRGDWIDTLSIRSLGTKINAVPVPGLYKATYAVWEKGKRVPTHTWDDAKKVPPELMQSTTDANGIWIPPQAQEQISAVFCVQGEPFPFVIVFKKTGLKAFNRRIIPMETQLAAAGMPPGMYELSSIDDKNAAGQAYKRLTAKYVGRPPEDLMKLTHSVFLNAAKFRALAEAAANDQAEGDPE